MLRLVSAIFLLSRVASAADACLMITPSYVTAILGTTKNTSVNSMKLPPKATEGKACQYVGKEYSGTVIVMRFQTAAAAHEYLQMVRKDLEKQSLKISPTTFAGEEGFSFANGILAAKKNVWIRVNVNPPDGKGGVNLELTRQLLLRALDAN